jgi:RND family efflux transporter MFP subunit
VRRDPAPATGPAPRRHLLTRYVLPGLVLAGFLAVFGYAGRDLFWPPRPVTVVPVLVTQAAAERSGAPLFQAAGWVEPRPTPILATALTEGFIERLLVVEGQDVRAGEPVAHLIDADAKLALQTAEAEAQMRQGELAQARAALTAAETRFRQPVHLEAALAEAAAALAKVETERAALPTQVRAAEARLKLARTDLEGKTAIGDRGAVSPRALAQSQSEWETAAAGVDELKARQTSLAREAEAMAARRDALKRQLELKTDEGRLLGDAEAGVTIADARSRQALAAVAAARLRIERLTVRAPQAGRVLSLIARPGRRVAGFDPGSMHDSSTVAVLYDPASLQVRADVPLDQVGKVVPGQPARIESEALPGGSVVGEVLRATSQANVQKNTLEVKVAIKDPPAVLKPDMLTRVTFLTAAPAAGASESGQQLRLLVPRALVENGPDGPRVWLADQAAGIARPRPVKLGAAGAGELVEVAEGLRETDKLIAGGRDGLRDGERVAVTGEDASIGVAAGTPQKHHGDGRRP